MIVDCTSCSVRGDACAGCVVTVVFDAEPGADVPWHGPGRVDLLGPVPLELSRRAPDDVDHAIVVLAAAGLLAPQEVPLSLLLSEPRQRRQMLGA